MNIINKISRPRIIAFLLIGILPIALLCFGIFLNLANVAFDMNFVLGYIALPFACLTVLFVSIFSDLKLKSKALICAITLVFFVTLVLSCGLIGG